jgi:hypothetical protein
MGFGLWSQGVICGEGLGEGKEFVDELFGVALPG